MELITDIVARMARRDRSRTEATLQADIRALILAARLNLTDDDLDTTGQEVALEAQVGDGTRRRIDIEVGSTVIEVKKSLASAGALVEATRQLGAYVHERVQQTGTRYLGILTDGHAWHLFVPDPDSDTGLIAAGKPLVVNGAADSDMLVEWLGAVLATVDKVHPSASAIGRALGADSPAYAADHATLRALLDGATASTEIQLRGVLTRRGDVIGATAR